jgi:hypothetical protein
MTKKTSNGSPNQAAKQEIRGTTSVIVASNTNNFAAGLLQRTRDCAPENEDLIRGSA